MNCKHKLSLAIALALTSTPLLAMGLGQIQVRSQLGQPLVAEIPLSVDSPAEAASLHVSMAPAKDFRRAGISLNQMAMPLQFTVTTNARGQHVIRVTTVDPVRAPYLDFLLQVNWTNGRLLREYTVLLDPPNYAPAGPAIAAAPANAARAASPAAAVPAAAAAVPATAVPAPATPAAATMPAVAPRVAGDTYGPVKSGQTLTQVARAVRPNGKVSMNQVMVALLAANPDAFVRGNINGLKRGAILRIPSTQQISARSATAAAAEVRRQIEDWRGATPKPTLLAGAGETGASRPAAMAAATAGGRLQLVPPAGAGQGAATRAGVVGGTGRTAIAGLKADLARSKESLASQRQRSEDLKARLKEVEGINSKNQQLLALKNDEIAELQRKLAQARTTRAATLAAATAPVKPAPAEKLNPVPAASTGKPAAAVSSAAPAASVAAASSAPATAASVRPAVAASVSRPAAVKPKPLVASVPVATEVAKPWYLQVWALVTAGAVVLLLLVLALRGRRRAPAPAAATGSIADQFGDAPFDRGDESDHEGDAEVRSLRAQMAEYPGDAGLHLELVSLYYARNDVAGFEAAAEAMHAEVDPASAEWQAVEAMGEELSPHHSLFERASPAAGTAPDPSAEPAKPDAVGDGEPLAASGYSFDFDLSPAHADVAAPGMHAPQPPLAGRDLPDGPELPSLDFGDEDALRRAAKEDQPAASTASTFSDDPADTKLDLARAYLDMGDRDGARAMLEEVLAEGSQTQKDEAHRLLGELG